MISSEHYGDVYARDGQNQGGIDPDLWSDYVLPVFKTELNSEGHWND